MNDLRYFRDCTPPYGRNFIVDGQRAAGRIKSSHSHGILATPSCAITRREVSQLSLVSLHRLPSYQLGFREDRVWGTLALVRGVSSRASKQLNFLQVRSRMSEWENPPRLLMLHSQ
jgi:hypothetical protein